MTPPVDIKLKNVANSPATLKSRGLPVNNGDTEHNSSYYEGKDGANGTPETPPHDLLENAGHINNESVVKSGWMMKKGSFRPSWKSRFFILSAEGWLSYYAKGPPKVSDRRGQLPIDGCQVSLVDSKRDKNNFCIQIKSTMKQRNLLVEVENAEDAEEWMRQLKLMIAKIGSLNE